MQTRGEQRVIGRRNPDPDPIVGEIQKKAAELIDLIESIKIPNGVEPGEVWRAKAAAQTSIEQGAMWGVKAATKMPPV